MPYLGIFGLEFENNIVMFEIIISTLSNCKISRKMKMPKFGTKNVLFGYFEARILKNYCHI